jgi:hypothetical protein
MAPRLGLSDRIAALQPCLSYTYPQLIYQLENYLPCGIARAGFAAHGTAFMGDWKARLVNRVQLPTDGRKAYLKAVAEVDFDADYAMLNKIVATDYQCVLQEIREPLPRVGALFRVL